MNPHVDGDEACACAPCAYARAGRANVHRLLTPENRAESAERMRRRWQDPEWRAKIIAARTGPRPLSTRIKIRVAANAEAELARRSVQMKAQWADPEFRERAMAGARTPEARAKVRQNAAERRYLRRLELGLTPAEHDAMKALRHKAKISTEEAVRLIKEARHR